MNKSKSKKIMKRKVGIKKFEIKAIVALECKISFLKLESKKMIRKENTKMKKGIYFPLEIF